jgi:hypothetical protein
MMLICGCGRSGTKYTATVLQRLGLDVGHERLGKDGIVSSMWALDVAEYPPYHEQGPQPEFDVILHQVRNPLDTIGSLTTALPSSWAWNAKHLPLQITWEPVRKAAVYWYYTNKHIERRAEWTYQVESLPWKWHEWCERLDINAEYGQVVDIPKNVNSREHQTVQWFDICKATELWPEILVMAKRYGYETKDTTILPTVA